jgi:hypothetical protein
MISLPGSQLTSQGRSDVVLFCPKHVYDGWLHFTQQKKRGAQADRSEDLIQSELKDILNASSLGADTYL